MIVSHVRQLFQKKEYKHILENFFSLSILNALSYLFPLITLPYLVRILGPDRFGAYSFALTIAQYLSLISLYGFNFTAVRCISQNREDKSYVDKIFSAVLVIRLGISMMLIASLITTSVFVPFLNHEIAIYLFSIGFVIGEAITPVWFFQGMEKMKYITLINLISKSVFTALIFCVIHKQSDYKYVMLLYSLGSITAGLTGIFIALKGFKIKFVLPTKIFIINQLREGWHMFVSTMSINLYRNSNVLILGIFTNNTIVGYYASAERIIKALQSLVSPITESLFPFFSRRFKTDIDNNLNVLFRFGKYFFFLLLTGTVILIFSSKFIVTHFLGTTFINSIRDMRILSLIILFGGMNYYLGIIGMVNIGSKKQFSYLVIACGLINIFLTTAFCRYYFDLAASISMVIAEFLLFILIIIQLRTHALKRNLVL